jgi:hypothetical protein
VFVLIAISDTEVTAIRKPTIFLPITSLFIYRFSVGRPMVSTELGELALFPGLGSECVRN